MEQQRRTLKSMARDWEEYVAAMDAVQEVPEAIETTPAEEHWIPEPEVEIETETDAKPEMELAPEPVPSAEEEPVATPEQLPAVEDVVTPPAAEPPLPPVRVRIADTVMRLPKVEAEPEPEPEPKPELDPSTNIKVGPLDEAAPLNSAETTFTGILTDDDLARMDEEVAAKRAAVDGESQGNQTKGFDEHLAGDPQGKEKKRLFTRRVFNTALLLALVPQAGAIGGVSARNLAEGNGPKDLITGRARGLKPESIPFTESVPTVLRWNANAVKGGVSKIIGDEKSQKGGK